MMFLRYLLFASVWILLALFQTVLGWMLIAPFVRADGSLPALLRAWFQPDDTAAIGDAMFARNEAAFTTKYPAWLARYIRAVMWGCRNPAYGWLSARGIHADRIEVELVYGDPFIDIGDSGARFGKCFRKATVNGKRYFDWKLVGRWGQQYGYMVRFGWNLSAGHSPITGTARNLYVDVRPRIAIKQ